MRSLADNPPWNMINTDNPTQTVNFVDHCLKFFIGRVGPGEIYIFRDTDQVHMNSATGVLYGRNYNHIGCILCGPLLSFKAAFKGIVVADNDSVISVHFSPQNQLFRRHSDKRWIPTLVHPFAKFEANSKSVGPTFRH